MANAFDPYREALVVEQMTIWPEEYDDWDPHERAGSKACCTPGRRKPPTWTTFVCTPASAARSPSRPKNPGRLGA